ncbi:unnamed protein product [Porites lobata]|uniref:Zinc finger MYM-type 2-like n=1 Tax=Porites lobata TaxID=104759 RepID=A0ABN8SDF8_9CNID|nr:unnamed protein product [Porites lobata]
MEESVDLHEEAGKENEQTVANLSPAEEATSKDEVEIEKFLQEQKSKNTQYKTKSDLNAWKKFCESLKESRAIENIPANELDLLLSKFFISVRKQNGTEYEPGVLSGFQRSFQRYLHEKGSLINILKDYEFSRDESRKLCWGDVGLASDPETDSEYLVWKSERGSKTRTGQDGGHQRAFEPKAHASNNKSRCPVEFYKAFRSHRPEAMLEPDAPFYLAINHRRKPNDKVWYLDRHLGKNEIGKFLKDAFTAGKLDDTNKKKVSNHSVRKTSVGRLLEADVQPNFVAQLSGHKNLKSLDSYHSASLKRQREMSAILNREPGTSAQSEENQVSTSTTTQQNVFTVQQMQFLPERILTSSKVAHLTSTFSAVIDRRSQG